MSEYDARIIMALRAKDIVIHLFTTDWCYHLQSKIAFYWHLGTFDIPARSHFRHSYTVKLECYKLNQENDIDELD
jgi:hypothetical protein